MATFEHEWAAPATELPEPTQTAMLLTQEEWDDLADICRFYQLRNALGQRGRRKTLCDRIIDAATL